MREKNLGRVLDEEEPAMEWGLLRQLLTVVLYAAAGKHLFSFDLPIMWSLGIAQIGLLKWQERGQSC